MPFTPYIHFDGNCREAMEFYCKLFDGTDFQVNTYAEMPDNDFSGADAARLMHSQFTYEGGMLMASDNPPGMPALPQQSVSISVIVQDADKGKGYFDALLDGGGEVTMPYEATFFSPGFGMVKDRFGTHWMIMTWGEEG